MSGCEEDIERRACGGLAGELSKGTIPLCFALECYVFSFVMC